MLLVSLAVALLGAGGMLAFEPAGEFEGSFVGYADALWWAAMLLTTMGSGYWPVNAEGRLLALLLSIYGFAVFGYITASFATFFIGQEAQDKEGKVVGVGDQPARGDRALALRAQRRALRTGRGGTGSRTRRESGLPPPRGREGGSDPSSCLMSPDTDRPDHRT